MSNVSAAAIQPPGIWDQVHRLVGWLRLLCYASVGLFALLVLVETVHIYRFAADIHPWVGFGWLIAVAICSSLVSVPAYRFLKMPRVVHPPPIPPADDLRVHHLREEVRYLDDYLAHLGSNPYFSNKRVDIVAARTGVGELAVKVRQASATGVGELDREIGAWVDRTMPPLLADVDQQADRLIYQESLAVGLATAASPNGTLDAFVMLWRSVNLVSKLSNLYYGRPGLWGTLAICRDVSVATAMAGYLQNVTDSLGGLLAKTAGGVTGVIAGPAVDGVTNALVLIRIGYLAQNRCRSFRKWDTATRRSAMIASIAATQRVAFGLATEIVKQVGGGLSAAAGMAGRGVAKIASNAAEGVGTAVDRASDRVNSVFARAVAWGQSLSKPPPSHQNNAPDSPV